MASAHCAAAIRDFRAQEFSPGRMLPEDWEKFVIYDGPVIKEAESTELWTSRVSAWNSTKTSSAGA